MYNNYDEISVKNLCNLIQNKNEHEAKNLFMQNKKLINILDQDSRSPLMFALNYCDQDSSLPLELAQGMYSNVLASADSEGNTALHMAVYKNRYDVLQIMLEKLDYNDLIKRNAEGNTIVYTFMIALINLDYTNYDPNIFQLILENIRFSDMVDFEREFLLALDSTNNTTQIDSELKKLWDRCFQTHIYADTSNLTSMEKFSHKVSHIVVPSGTNTTTNRKLVEQHDFDWMQEQINNLIKKLYYDYKTIKINMIDTLLLNEGNFPKDLSYIVDSYNMIKFSIKPESLKNELLRLPFDGDRDNYLICLNLALIKNLNIEDKSLLEYLLPGIPDVILSDIRNYSTSEIFAEQIDKKNNGLFSTFKKQFSKIATGTNQPLCSGELFSQETIYTPINQFSTNDLDSSCTEYLSKESKNSTY